MAGLTGEKPIGELCRRYRVSQTTYYKLRDAFLHAGVQGLEHRGHASEVAALRDRVRQVERILGSKTLQVEILKRIIREAREVIELAAEFGRVIAPPYDDELLGCGGCAHRQRGNEVLITYCSDGARGTPDGSLDLSLPERRRREAEAGLVEVGGADSVHPGLPDGRLGGRAGPGIQAASTPACLKA